MTIPSAEIKQTFSALRKEKKRHRDIAETLGISEAELISAHVGETTSTDIMSSKRLKPLWSDIIEALTPLGDVLALTRNPACVNEKVGTYKNLSHDGHVGLALGEIDLRIFYSNWAYGFAVTEEGERGTQRSLQFFDKAGDAVHKIFVRPETNIAAYDALVDQFASDIVDPVIEITPNPAKAPEKNDQDIDVAGFKAAWENLTDTHQFFGMLRKFSVTRTQALRLADKKFVQRIDNHSVNALLHHAVENSTSIMVFVGNHGMIQIHTGPISNVAEMGPWINVMDPRFNLHLRTDLISSAWVVKKPTADGIVTSIEYFDEEGNVIAMFFGERKPGKPELASWRALVEQVAAGSEVAA